MIFSAVARRVGNVVFGCFGVFLGYYVVLLGFGVFFG